MTYKMKNMAYWKRKNALPGINHESDKNMPDGRAKSSPLQKEKSFFEQSTGAPVETDDTKKGNVSAYSRKNQQYVDKDKTTPLDPGYEDTKKIQKVQSEGITPHSQKFGEIHGKGWKPREIHGKGWKPAFEGADHSEEELKKMSKKEKRDYYE